MKNSFPIHYETFGNSSNPCLILIMGLGGQMIQWPKSFITMLVDAGFYVLIFDNRDAGLSHYHEDLPIPNIQEVFMLKMFGLPVEPPYSLKDMATDVIMLMDKLDIAKAHIAGISMGGMIAQLLAADYPDRILSLTCIATTSSELGLPGPTPEVLSAFLAAPPLTDTIEMYLERKMALHQLYHHPDHHDENDRELFIKLYERANDHDGFKRQLLAILCAEPRTEKLQNLQLPILVIHGDYDPVFPVEHGHHLAQIIPNVSFKIVEKMGHGITESLSGELANLIVAHIKPSSNSND